jgi:hypothetical protein
VPPTHGCPQVGHAYPEVTHVICLVPLESFSQAPWYTLPDHLCRFRVRSIRGSYFLGQLYCTQQSNKHAQLPSSVTTHRPRNIHRVPIDYAFQPRLRGRLTLHRLALCRNPWSFGESVSHTLCRYSCQHSHFRYLQQVSQLTFTGLRNAPLPRLTALRASVHGFSPGTSSAQEDY